MLVLFVLLETIGLLYMCSGIVNKEGIAIFMGCLFYIVGRISSEWAGRMEREK